MFVDYITGIMFGFEIVDDEDDDSEFLVIDLFIIRLFIQLK